MPSAEGTNICVTFHDRSVIFARHSTKASSSNFNVAWFWVCASPTLECLSKLMARKFRQPEEAPVCAGFFSLFFPSKKYFMRKAVSLFSNGLSLLGIRRITPNFGTLDFVTSAAAIEMGKKPTDEGVGELGGCCERRSGNSSSLTALHYAS